LNIIAQLHGQVIKALFSRFDDDITVYYKNVDQEIMMASFPRTKSLWNDAFHMMKVTNARNDKAIIMVGHQIATPLSLFDLKQGIQDTLREVNGFIKINDWGIHLDLRSAGFLANLHPVHHNRELIQSGIAKFLNDSMCDDNESLPMPDFKVVPSSANESQSNKRVSSRFLAITCKNSEDALFLRKKLVAAYSTLPTPIDPSLGFFIPSNAKYSDKEIFRILIRRQNQYLAHHRNIPMDGINDKLLFARTAVGKSVLDELLVGAQICRIDSCPTRDYTGRYNLSTTENHFIKAVKWLDTELPLLIADIPKADRGDFEGCVERISPQVSSLSNSTTASRTSTTSYLSALTLGFGSDHSADDGPPKIRRKSRYNPMIEFDFEDTIDFPALPVEAPKPRPLQPHRSPQSSAKSASSSITRSDINAVRSEIQSKFDNDMKQFKKDSIDHIETEIATAVKNSVATALEGINATMNKMLSANNSIVYDNMKSERDIITNPTADAVAKRVDIAVTDAVTRALASHTRSSSASPTCKKEKRSNPTETNPDAVMENSKVVK
jgi:hypothetical protein